MRRNSRLSAIAGFAAAVILLAAGGLLLWGSTYVHNTVQGQLASQQIFFPPKAAFAHPVAGTEITVRENIKGRVKTLLSKPKK